MTSTYATLPAAYVVKHMCARIRYKGTNNWSVGKSRSSAVHSVTTEPSRRFTVLYTSFANITPSRKKWQFYISVKNTQLFNSLFIRMSCFVSVIGPMYRSLPYYVKLYNQKIGTLEEKFKVHTNY